MSVARPFALNLSRRCRWFTLLLSLCALLFTQTALAAYACQGAAQALLVAQMAEAQMPCADSMSKAMDDTQPALCHAHCQSSSASAEPVQLPPLASVAQLGAVLTVRPAAGPEPGRTVQPALLRPSASPPLAISHCCWRI